MAQFLPIFRKICNFAPMNIKKKGNEAMARPIKETPILHGEDARRFIARMREKRRETPEQKASRMADYELILGMLKRGEELKKRHAAVL